MSSQPSAIDRNNRLYNWMGFKLLPIFLLWGCYSAPKVEGFDSDKWKSSLETCDGYRQQSADLLIEQMSVLKGSGQNSIHELLGKPTRHELYKRNQKFFYYDLTCADVKPGEQLLIRFDALGNLREVSRELSP